MTIETKAERFKRIVNKRTNEIHEKIRILGNCSNRNAYDYSEEDVAKVFRSIEQELKLARVKFVQKKKNFSI